MLAASAGRKRAPLAGRRAVSPIALGTIENKSPMRPTHAHGHQAPDSRMQQLVAELLRNLAPHGVDDVTLTCSLLSCFLDD